MKNIASIIAILADHTATSMENGIKTVSALFKPVAAVMTDLVAELSSNPQFNGAMDRIRGLDDFATPLEPKAEIKAIRHASKELGKLFSLEARSGGQDKVEYLVYYGQTPDAWFSGYPSLAEAEDAAVRLYRSGKGEVRVDCVRGGVQAVLYPTDTVASLARRSEETASRSQ